MGLTGMIKTGSHHASSIMMERSCTAAWGYITIDIVENRHFEKLTLVEIHTQTLSPNPGVERIE